MVTKTISATVQNIGTAGYSFIMGCSIGTAQPVGSGTGLYFPSGTVTDLPSQTKYIDKGATSAVSFAADFSVAGTYYAIVKVWKGPGTTNCLAGDWKAFTVSVAEQIGATILAITIT